MNPEEKQRQDKRKREARNKAKIKNKPIDKDFKTYNPLSVLLYKSMLYFKERGFENFDFGGYSKDKKDQICYYKQGFNAEEYKVKRVYGALLL